MSTALAALEQVRTSFGGDAAATKLALLAALEHARLRSAAAVERLHEALSFLRAYPDNAAVLAQVERMLARFHRRADLRAHRTALADSGIAGTAIHYRFFAPTALWLARRWPERLRLDRSDPEPAARIANSLPLLVTPAEAAWLKESGLSAYAALERLRAPGETDAAFMVRRIEALPGDAFTREAFHDAIDMAYRLDPGPDTPSRTRAHWPDAPAAFQREPLRRGRPDLAEQIALAPRSVTELVPREGARLIELARGVMITRARDLDAFAYGDPRDVRLVDDGGGLAFMVNGVIPGRRALVMAMYGFLTLKNGVPVGYGQVDLTGRAAALSFNTFATFRGGEAAWTFARLLAMVRHVFGAESFSLEPYQLGDHNAEGIASGAWWFYQKLGFRPRAPGALAIMRDELARMKANPHHRSERATLRRLAKWHLFYDLDPRKPVPLPDTARPGERVAHALAHRGGSDRARAIRECRREALALLGMKTLKGWTADERLAWDRWAPLVVSIGGLGHWSAAEKRALARIVRAKGGRRESDYVALFAAHRRLERDLLAGR